MKELTPFVVKSCFGMVEYSKCEEEEEEEGEEEAEENIMKYFRRRKIMELGDLPRRLELLLLSPVTTWR